MNARRRRLTILLLIVIPITVLFVATLIYITTQVRYTLRNLDAILVEQVQQQTNRAVKVGKVDVSILGGTATIHDLKIANGKTFNAGTLLNARRVIIKFRFMDLVRRKVPAIQTVESVRLISPTIRLDRFRNGKFNISDLLKRKPGPPRPPFIGVLDVSDGTLILHDWLAKVPGPRPVITRVVNIGGTFDATNFPVYVYNFTAKGPKGKLFDTLSVSGSIDNKTSVISTDIVASNAAVAYWMSYFVKIGAVKAVSGRGDIRLSTSGRLVKGKRVWQYTGSADVRNARAALSMLKEQVSGVKGTVRLANQRLDFNLNGSIIDSPVRMTGTMAGFAKPRFNLRVSSTRMNYPRLISAVRAPANLGTVRLAGRGPLALSIVGPVDKLAIRIIGRIPAASVNGYQASDINIRATYAQNLISVESASANAVGGRITTSGMITMLDGTTSLALYGNVSGIELARIPQLRRAKATGVATGRFTVAGTTSNPKLNADVQVSRGTLNNVGYSNAIARLTITSDRVIVRSIAAAVAGGVVRASGYVASRVLSLRVAAVGVDLSILQRQIGLTGYRGVANFAGSVTGPIGSPIVVGKAEVFEGRFQRFAFDYIRGRIVATTSGITLENAVVRVLPAELTLRGKIVGINTPTPNIQIDIDVADAPADRILSILQVRADVTGTVNGRISIRGTTSNIVATGNLTLSDGSVAGYPVTQSHAAFGYANGELRLTDLVARSDNAVFSAEGIINRSGGIALDFIANDLSLAQLSQYIQPYATLSGTVDARGRVTGTMDAPGVTATVVSNNPVINTVRLDKFAAEVDWNRKSLTVANLNLLSGNGAVSVKRATINSVTGAVQVEGGVIQNFSYPTLYTAVSESPYINQPAGEGLRSILARLRRPDTGTISAEFSATGPMDALEAKFSLTAQDVDIAEIKDARIQLSAVSRKGEVILESFDATAEALSVSAQGTLIADGQTDLEVDAYNVDLDALTPTTGPTHISGIATVRASVRGPIDAPLVTASAEVVNPVLYGIVFDRLRASQITINQNKIEISRALITRGAQSATFYGEIPWDWTTFAVPADQPIAFHAALEEQTLEILTVLTDSIKADPKNPGRITATMDIGGTISNPNLSGRMNIVNGNVSVKYFNTMFTNIQANLVFDQDMVRVENFSGASSGGGTFEVVPGGTISLRNLIKPVPGQSRGVIDLLVRLNDLNLSEQNLFGYQERITGTFSAANGLAVAGTVGEPLISGKVSARDATVIISRTPVAPSTGASKYAINPKFNIGFSVDNNVWFRNPSIVALMRGDGQISGTLEKPLVVADIRITSGTLRLPTARMRITRGIITVNWSPGDPTSRVNVDLRAQTSLTTTSPLGAQQRYTITLEVNGPLERLEPQNINLKSEPAGLSRTQILAALGHFEDIFGTGETELRDQLRDLFSVAVSPRLFDPLESTFIEALGLEDFSIEYGFEQPLAVFLSRRVFDNFYMSYWQIVTGTPNITGATYSLRFSYRLRDWLELGYVVDSRRVSSIEASYSRRF